MEKQSISCTIKNKAFRLELPFEACETRNLEGVIDEVTRRVGRAIEGFYAHEPLTKGESWVVTIQREMTSQGCLVHLLKKVLAELELQEYDAPLMRLIPDLRAATGKVEGETEG